MNLVLLQFIWQSILIYCLWLQMYVNKRYSMKTELTTIILVGFLLDILSISYLLIYTWNEDGLSAMSAMCS